MENLLFVKDIIEKKYYQKSRRSLSLRFKFLVPFIIIYRRMERYVNDYGLDKAHSKVKLDENISNEYYVLHKHSSPLMRKLGNDKNTELLQKSKIKNLEIAAQSLNGIRILPGETFSLWESLGGPPTKKKGYQQGMLLSQGKVVSGIGGGLCQMSNLLYWLILHTDLEVVERHHHSLDVFKDSGRTVPFGTGSTIFFPTLDLRFRNNYKHSIILNIYLTETQLVGRFLVQEKESKYKYHVYDSHNGYYKYKDTFYRFNRVYREKILDGQIEETTLLYENLFPTLYIPDNFVEIKNTDSREGSE